MPYNPTHNRKTWLAVGNPGDPVAFDVAGEKSMISLLKGILSEFGFPFIPLHSISFDKLQQVVGPVVLGRGAGLGDVLPQALGRGLEMTATTLQTTGDVPLGSGNNFWSGTNFFASLASWDNSHFAIVNESDQSKILRFDLSTMVTGNTLKVRMPTVGYEGSGEVGTLALLKGTEGGFFAQPRDDDLTALSALTAVDTMYYRRADNPPLWAPVVIGANLVFNGGTLSATGGGGPGGGISTAGPVTAAMLAAFADASGTLIQGVTVSGPGIAYASGLLQTTGDLLALENLTGSNVLYYRAADAVWSAVTYSNAIGLVSGQLALSPTLQALGVLANVADTVPYFTGASGALATAFTVFGRSLVGAANAAAALTLLGAQPVDGDLTAISALSGTNTIYYRSGTSTWSPVTIGANLTFVGGTLAATGGGGGGVSTSGAVTAAMLTGYADATGLLIRGITMPGAGLTLVGAALTLANDLSALEALSGTNNIYYRSGVDTWSPVTFSGLTFTGGVLAVSGGGGGVTTSGAVTASMMTGYADATGNLIRGINLPAAGIALSGNNMVLTNDLASLEAAASTGVIYHRSAADTWTPVTVGGGLGFTAPNLTITNVALVALGGVTPAADRVPYFNSTTTAALAVFTAAGRTLVSQPDAASMVGILGAQPLDADLTSLAGATGTNTIYYRSAANTWSPVVVGTNLTFTGGTLAATGGGGDVFKNLANTFTAANAFINTGVVIGHTALITAVGLEVHGLTTSTAGVSFNEWSNDGAAANLNFSKSRGAAPGTHVTVVLGDTLGTILFNASNGTNFITRAQILGSVNPSVTSGTLSFSTHDGGAMAERMRVGHTAIAQTVPLLLGTLASLATGAALGAKLNLHYAAGDPGSHELQHARWTADAVGPAYYFDKSRGTTVGAFTAVASGDAIGSIFFRAAGSSALITAAKIITYVNGALGAGIPSAMEFHTATAAGTMTNCISITPGGVNIIGVANAGNAAVGYVGEYQTRSVTHAVGATSSGAPFNSDSFTLSPGDWEISGSICFSADGTFSVAFFSLSQSSGTTSFVPGTVGLYATGAAIAIPGQIPVSFGPIRYNVSSNTTFYTVGYYTGGGPSVSANAMWRARRIH